ncbi:MAG: fasciclin domain-containing protein [Cyanomargarita calcarea GSE-NOS-MK-12-04C]|uniref:Fasciclin domain-containing protein n=1 Tax=Cyanomargarita calcarea GSE-NOS-MK-12-04C TaxID=2839659 RepID=A0A951UVC7_9CYAN|nr:fasciclin domain-containing protein [Cyanomargarita calcarea GSE-NOS-MK-12-04C]
MKALYSNFFTKLTCIFGVSGISLLLCLPSKANEVINTHLNPKESTVEVQNKDKKPSSQKPQQKLKPRLNPSPRILQECPYNRAACPASGSPAPEPEQVPTTETPNTETRNLVTLFEENGSFTMLIKALKAAGLTETLQGPGSFTIFAPTDKAFAQLPKDAVRDLFKPENKEVLVKILTYHVVSGQALSRDLKTGEVKSSEGGSISVKIKGQDLMVNDAKVINRDIKASNGIIHVIDKVILPPDL